MQRGRAHVPKGPKGVALSERAARVSQESSRIGSLQRVGQDMRHIMHHVKRDAKRSPNAWCRCASYRFRDMINNVACLE